MLSPLAHGLAMGAIGALLLARRRRVAWAALFATAALSACHADPSMTATTQHWTVSVTPRPEIRVNQHFGLVVKVRDKTGEAPKRVRVDADMPSHKHGMNTEPRITAQQDGSWLVEGMLFHMPGAWELYVYIGEGTALECATFGVDL